jgi:hypothetical protein
MNARIVCRGSVVLACWAALWVAAGQAQNPGGPWTSLFDGKTLNGWHQVGELLWVVEDGAIVGRITERSKLYSLLVSDKVFRDFTVRLKFKTVQGNSGFYIRTIIEDPDRAHGLQIEVDPKANSGGIYESYGRAWVEKPSDELQAKYFKPGEWNEFVISAYGGNVEVKVNGITSAKLQNETSRPAGHLAMQMHAGNEMLVLFKDIEIQVAASGAETPAPTQPALVQPDKGRLNLTAKTARVSGAKPAYLPGWDALCNLQANDRAEWDVEVVKPGLYDVSLEWAADGKQGERSFALVAGANRLEGKVAATGGKDIYRLAKVGQIELPAGQQKVCIQAGEASGPVMDLRKATLTLAKPEKPAKPAAPAKKK